MLRILQCVVGMNRGGIETLLMNVYRRVDRSLLQFDFLVSIDGTFDDEIKQLGGKIYKIPFISKIGPIAYERALLAFFRSHPEYNIIHVHMDKFGGELVRVAKRAGIEHRILHSHSVANEGNVLVRILKDYYGSYVADATARFACSEDAARWMFGSCDNVSIVKNGIDLQRFSPIDRRDPVLFAVGSVSRFSPAKNHSFMIDVFEQVVSREKNARLVLVGTGDTMEKIQKKAEKLGLADRIEFLGALSDVESIYQRLDVFFLPSFFEGFSISALEAQSCSVPCIVSTAVPFAVNVTGAVEYISLKESATHWAEAILEHKREPRIDKRDVIADAGYDIEHATALLQDYYIGLSCKR